MHDASELFTTVGKEAHVEFEEKRSVFIGHAIRTDTEEEARCSVVKHGAALHATGLSKNGKWYRINFTYTDENGKQVTLENLYIYNGKYVSDTQPTETAPAAE